jgi:hypothetical protein
LAAQQMTVEEFLRPSAGQDGRSESIDGESVAASPSLLAGVGADSRSG